MDALRKAEEAKKQAEQGDEAKPEEQPDADSAAAESAPAGDSADSGNIPDVALEFESEAPPDEASPESEATESPEPDLVPESATEQLSESDGDSLSLEPIDDRLSSATRQGFDADYTPDYSAELTSTASSVEPTKAVEDTADESDSMQAHTDDDFESAEDSNEEESSSAPEYGVVVNNPEAVRAALSASHEKLQAQENLERAISEPSPERMIADRSEGSLQDEIETNNQRDEIVPETKDKLTLTPQQETISERSAASRSGARNLFAAKQQGKRKRLRIRRSTKIWAAQITIVLMVAVGAYFYFFVVNNTTDNFNVPAQFLANQDSFSENFNESLEVAAVTEEPIEEESIPLDGDFSFEIPEETAIDDAAQVIADVDAAEQVNADAEPETETATTGQADIAPAVADSEPVVADGQEQQSAPGELEPEVTQQLVQSQGPSNTISFTRSGSSGGVDPLLRDAYAAFQRDNLVLAQSLYQQVLSNSPRNRDALLGLAAIANSNGERNLAMELYSRLLARDPSDAVARAGLMGLRPLGGPEQQERELRRLMELHPQVAPVNYALGNFYAGQSRWTDAQRHYFNALQQAKTDALQGLPVNPDYAFNLAVSLEHLNQGAAAEVYYREAVAFAAEFPASFDVNIARERLIELAEVNL